MNKYELTLILDGKATAAKKKSVLESMAKTIKLHEGKAEKAVDWGVKEMFHEIKKVKEGLYLHIQFEMIAKNIKSFEVKLKAVDDILRYLVVNVEK